MQHHRAGPRLRRLPPGRLRPIRREATRTKPPMTRVIFACVHSAGRSQMAATFFNVGTDPAKACALSAGTRPSSRVHPVVVEAMREIGIDLSSAQPQQLTPALAAGAGWLVTMGCGDECPVVLGVRTEDWALDRSRRATRCRGAPDPRRDSGQSRAVHRPGAPALRARPGPNPNRLCWSQFLAKMAL